MASLSPNVFACFLSVSFLLDFHDPFGREIVVVSSVRKDAIEVIPWMGPHNEKYWLGHSTYKHSTCHTQRRDGTYSVRVPNEGDKTSKKAQFVKPCWPLRTFCPLPWRRSQTLGQRKSRFNGSFIVKMNFQSLVLLQDTRWTTTTLSKCASTSSNLRRQWDHNESNKEEPWTRS